MNKHVFRLIAVAALGLSLVVRTRTEALQHVHDKVDFRGAVVAVMKSKMSEVRELRTGFAGVLADCPRPIIVTPLALSLFDAPILQKAMSKDYKHRFVYIEAAQTGVRQFWLYLEWCKQTVLASIGATPYLPLKRAVMVSTPPECEMPATVDWQSIWREDNRCSDLRCNPVGGSQAR
ncbi:MAG: hypothetical protein ACKVP4_14390 [Hyphomicrobium sp.]